MPAQSSRRPLLHMVEFATRTLNLPASAKMVLLAACVGLVAGVGAIAFDVSGQFVRHVSAAGLAGFSPEEAIGEHSRFEPTALPLQPWKLILVMATGGLVSGLLVYTFAPEAKGPGTDAAIDAFHNNRGLIRGRVPIIKTLASIITLGTGGSGGREGPIAQIGAGFGSWLGQRLKLPSRDTRILLAAGMGAGVGAIFRAPLAGAVFAAEILYSDADLEADALVPAATSSVVAYSIYTQSLPPETRFMPLFGDDLNHSFSTPLELVPYSLLAIALTVVGMVYVKCFYGTRSLFSRIPIRAQLKPALGAGLAGCLALAFMWMYRGDARVLNAALGTGYGTLQSVLIDAPKFGIALLLAIALAKIATTSLTISSGGSGGVFGPSMVIGGSVGAAVGLLFQASWPGIVQEPEAYAVVGMAGFFAGVARAPLSTIIMVRALTGDFGLLVPTMLVTTLTFLMSRRWTLYRMQVPTRLDSPAHRGDFIVDVLEGLQVADVYERERKVVTVDEGLKLDDIVHRLADNNQHYFPVVDQDQRVVGIFSDDDIRSYLFNDELWDIVLARDLMVERFLYVTPQDDLNTALRRFTTKNLDELPVIDDEAGGQLLGMLRRKAVIAAYNRRLLDFKNGAE